MTHRFLTENCLINVDFVDNEAGEITAAAYFVSTSEIICPQVRSRALLSVNNYILGLLCETGASICLIPTA